MSESILQLDIGSPLDIYGPGDKYLNEIKELFPTLKIIARGELIKLIGDQKQIRDFEKKFDLLLIHFDKFGKINEDVVKQVMGSDEPNNNIAGKEDDVLVYGRHGKLIRALTPNQKKMVSIKKDLISKLLFEPVVDANSIRGVVVHIDSYENLITNIPRSLFKKVVGNKKFSISFRSGSVSTISDSYGDVRPGEIVALFASNDMLEVAINKGNASSLLGIGWNDTVFINIE